MLCYISILLTIPVLVSPESELLLYLLYFKLLDEDCHLLFRM
jgi:hypothetical protein